METKKLLNKKITQWLLLGAMLVGCSANALAAYYMPGGWPGGNWGWGDYNKFVSNKITMNLAANATYEFKITNGNGWTTQYGNEGTMKRDNCSDWTFKSGKGNCTIKTDIAGTYTFTLNTSGPKLSVTYPYVIHYHNDNAWHDEDLVNGQAVIHLKKGNHDFTIETSNYYGNSGTMVRSNCTNWPFSNTSGVDNKCTITADIEGDYTFSWVESSKQLSVTYPAITYTYKLGGLGKGWSDGGTTMSVSGSTATCTVSLTAKTYSGDTDGFKIMKMGNDGTTTYRGNNGIMTRDNCSGWTMDSDAGNCRITADVAGNYTFSYDINTHKLTVTYPTITYTATATVGSVAGGTVTIDTETPSSTSVSKTVASGTTVAFKATASTSYNFKGWGTTTSATTFESTDNPYNVAITADKTLYAIFEVACTPPTITDYTDGTRCGTGTVTLSATASAGDVKWYASLTGGDALYTGGSYTTTSISKTTKYYAEADDNGCVSTSRTEVVATVITRPAAPISGGDISVCYGSDAEFKATQANNRCIDWYTASTGGTKLETCQTTYTKTSLTSDYTVYAEARIADNGCISASRTAIKATVNALPTASISGSDEVCQNGSLTLTGSGGTQYSWNNADYSSKSTYDVPTSTSGQKEITLKVKDSNNCESASADQKNVTVKTQPTAGTISGDPVCKGSTATLEVTNPSSASVQWQNSSKEDISGATNASYTTPALQTSTDYYVKFTKDGCSSTSAKGTATVKTTSLSLTATPATVNPYTRVTLTAKNQSGKETNSNWTITGAGSYFTESENPTDVSSVVMKPAKGVETTVTATATVDGCPVSDTYSVTPTADTETCN